MQLSKRERGNLISTIEQVPNQVPTQASKQDQLNFYHELAKYAECYFQGIPPTGFSPKVLKIHSLYFDLLRNWYEVLLLGWNNLSSNLKLPFNSPFGGLRWFILAHAEIMEAAAAELTEPKKISERNIHNLASVTNKQKRGEKLTPYHKKKLNSAVKRLTQYRSKSLIERENFISDVIEFASSDPQAERKAKEYQKTQHEITQLVGSHAHPRFKGKYFPG